MSSCVCNVRKYIMYTIYCLTVMFLSVPYAQASNVLFDVMAPHEYDCPVNYDDFNVYIEYMYYQMDNKAWNNNGDSVGATPHLEKAVALSKYVRFYSIKAIPNVGFAWEIVVPSVSVQGRGVSVTGIGDPITPILPVMWIKPTKNSTFGFQNLLQMPFGTKETTDGNWKNYNGLFGNAKFFDNKLVIDGHAGVMLQTKAHKHGTPDVDPGTILHSGLRIGYEATKHLCPYFGWDWATTGSTKDDNGNKIPNSANYEHEVRGGLMVNITPKFNAAVAYSYGIAGKNTNRTNAINLKICYVF